MGCLFQPNRALWYTLQKRNPLRDLLHRVPVSIVHGVQLLVQLVLSTPSLSHSQNLLLQRQDDPLLHPHPLLGEQAVHVNHGPTTRSEKALGS